MVRSKRKLGSGMPKPCGEIDLGKSGSCELGRIDMYNHKRIMELTVKELELDLEEQKDKVESASCLVEVRHGTIMTLILAYKELYNSPLKAVIVKKQQQDKVKVIKDEEEKETFKFGGEGE
jgi:hypothetical protein